MDEKSGSENKAKIAMQQSRLLESKETPPITKATK
jgi:hypothetical protein